MPPAGMDRSYHGENRPSQQHWACKHHWARPVVRWGTTCEPLVTICLAFWRPYWAVRHTPPRGPTRGGASGGQGRPRGPCWPGLEQASPHLCPPSLPLAEPLMSPAARATRQAHPHGLPGPQQHRAAPAARTPAHTPGMLPYLPHGPAEVAGGRRGPRRQPRAAWPAPCPRAGPPRAPPPRVQRSARLAGGGRGSQSARCVHLGPRTHPAKEGTAPAGSAAGARRGGRPTCGQRHAAAAAVAGASAALPASRRGQRRPRGQAAGRAASRP